MPRIPSVIYRVYERRLRELCRAETLPQHVGIILDGNRRWASQYGTDVYSAYMAGGRKLNEVLNWCDAAGIQFVTAWMLSTDNLSRPPAEVEPLCRAIEETVKALADRRDRRVVHLGALDRLPASLLQTLKEAEESTRHIGQRTVNVAIGYGGRDEIVEALKSVIDDHLTADRSIDEVIDSITTASISEKLYTKGQPDPDLIIRTSGEQRLSGFLLWQTAHSEFYFCDVLWPEFRSVDFWRSMRSYTSRQRRYGR